MCSFRLSVVFMILFGLVLIAVTAFHEYRLYKGRVAHRLVMKKYVSKWKNLAKKKDKRTMGISMRTVMTLKMMQRNQIAAARADNVNVHL